MPEESRAGRDAATTCAFFRSTPGVARHPPNPGSGAVPGPVLADARMIHLHTLGLAIGGDTVDKPFPITII